MFASYVWVKTLIESDNEPYRGKDLNSWMFLRFNTIITLDPKFYDAYLFGGKYLSIIKDDVRGAEVIFAKGLLQFPEDFWLNINAAHNYLFEMGYVEKALILYKKVQFQPLAIKNFPILPSLVSKLERERGNLETTFHILELSLQKQESKEFHKYYLNNLYALRAEIDLNCLNSRKKGCNQHDYFGYPYIFRNGYVAKLPWKKFEFSRSSLNRINKKREKSVTGPNVP